MNAPAFATPLLVGGAEPRRRRGDEGDERNVRAVGEEDERVLEESAGVLPPGVTVIASAWYAARGGDEHVWCAMIMVAGGTNDKGRVKYVSRAHQVTSRAESQERGGRD